MAGMLEGKVVLVTGAARGIGRESALLFAREGALVAVADLTADGVEETAKLITNAGGEATLQQRHREGEGAPASAIVLRCFDRLVFDVPGERVVKVVLVTVQIERGPLR